MKDLNLLPETNDLYVEWSTQWIAHLISIFRESDKLDDLLHLLNNSEEIIKTSTVFGNQIKMLLKDKELGKFSKEARIIMLSAHCPKRPDPEYPK
jgi:hypothetical protein